MRANLRALLTPGLLLVRLVARAVLLLMLGALVLLGLINHHVL